MEAKTWQNTVMSDEQIMKAIPSEPDNFTMEDCRLVAKAQDAITWEKAFKAGIEEVVEWIEKHRAKREIEVGLATILWRALEAQLKIWGIE